MNETIGHMLANEGKLDELSLKKALSEQGKTGEPLEHILLKNGYAAEKDILDALSVQYNLPVLDLKKQKIDETIARKIPVKFIYRNKILPIRMENNFLLTAIASYSSLHSLDDLKLLLNCDVKGAFVSEKELMKHIKNIYGIGAETMEQLTNMEKTEEKEDKSVFLPVNEENPEDASIIKFVNQIIREAYFDGATDIHIEPFEKDLVIRYRVDGVLHAIPTPQNIRSFQSSIVSRIKIMSGMNIAEKRLPQDGRIQFTIDKVTVDLRVSTLPIIHGESIDLRILPRSQMFLGLEKLGLPDVYLDIIEKLIRKPHGIILVTGPTGHGKTTTLYACLSKINTVDKKIITVEDPIEYQLKGINQVPVHHKIGLDFASGLRSILRQDPDIIMVGEIRDQETAEIAIRSSLTGHLVFSTLHTNDSAGAITRLIDMGIEPYLVSSSIEAVMAQRLIRLVCTKCRKELKVTGDFLAKNNVPFTDAKDSIIFKAGPGCDECMHTGYKGRTGIYELLLLDEELRRLILEKTFSGNIKKEAIYKGLTTLRQDGWRKILLGQTTIEEVMRVIQEESF